MPDTEKKPPETMDEARARAKEAVADLTDDDELRREAKVDRASGAAKQRVDQAGGKAEEARESIKDKIGEVAEKVKQKVGRG